MLCGTRRQKWEKHELSDRIGGRQGDGGIQELIKKMILPILDTLDTFYFGRRASRISLCSSKKKFEASLGQSLRWMAPEL